MGKAVKEMVAADVIRRIGDAKDFLVVDAAKLRARATTTLRAKLRDGNVKVLSVKNSMARKIFRERGQDAISSLLAGPTCLVWGSTDIVQLTKTVVQLTKAEKNISVKGGLVDGQAVNGEQVEAISNGPSREELIGKIVMLTLSPGAQLAAALLGAGGKLAGQVLAISEKAESAQDGEAPVGADAAAAG